MSASWLFIANMRTSTTLLWIAFCFVGVIRHDLRRAVLAGVTWLLGWEVAWGLTRRLTTHQPLGPNLLLFAASAAIVLALQWKAVKPSLPLIALSLVIGAAWLATGFHVNGYRDLAHFNALGEAFNEAAKSAWGLAYLLPLLRLRQQSSSSAELERSRGPSAAPEVGS